MDPTHDPLEPDAPRDADARIDALARSAGAELRRPAPDDGVTRVRRQHRRRQAVLAGATGTGVLAAVIGALVFTGGDDRSTVVPATEPTTEVSAPATTAPDETTPDDTTPDDTTPDDTTPDETTPDETTPDTSAPDDPTTDVPPNAAGDPDVVYVSADGLSSFGSEVSTIDPRTGAVTSTYVVDEALSDAARAAQDALIPASVVESSDRMNGGEYFTFDARVGDLVFTTEGLPSEVTDLSQFSSATLERFDRCGQSTLAVSGATAAALPERVTWARISADGRWLVTASIDCPDEGTLADGSSQRPATVTVQAFDTTALDRPGLLIADGIPRFDFWALDVSPDGEFLSIRLFADPGVRLFRLSSGDEVLLFSDDCSAQGTKWSRFIGPWIGESSVALGLSCGDGARLLVHDLSTGEELTVESPDDDPFATIYDVDFGHYDRPANVWYTMCSSARSRCFIAQGDGEPVELPGVAQASFLPLGFEYGG